MKTLLVAAALALTPLAAQAIEMQPSVSVQGFGKTQKKCRTWTDGCVTCNRGSCSNIGIACQPGRIECTDGHRLIHRSETK